MDAKSQRRSASSSDPFIKFAELIAPWALFLALLLWGWRVKDLFHAIPAYGDVLEVVWGIAWYSDHLLDRKLWFYPLIFHPEGWQVTTFSFGPLVFIPLIPLYRAGGAAFAYNVATLACFFIAFAGMYRLAQSHTRSTFVAIVASLLFTFWGLRWLRIGGHLNILLGSSMLPWLVWSLERAFYSQHRSKRWFILVGVLWALTIANSLYFLWIGGLVIVGWTLGRYLGRQIEWRAAIYGTITSAFVALLLNIPIFYLFIHGYKTAAVPFYDFYHLNAWGASLNSIFVPFVFHPWLGALAREFYRGELSESGVANFGILASCIILTNLRMLQRDKERWPALILTSIGILLALGLTLKWDGRSVQWDRLQPLNSAIWQIAHHFKPGFFTSVQPVPPFDKSILLPGLGLVALVPFWEGARILSRFALVAGVGFFLLVSQEVGRWRYPLARLGVAILLVVEIIPPPSGSVPFPPSSHPAFEWLRQETLPPQEGIVDLVAPQPYILNVSIRAEILVATQFHGKATVSGANSVWPGHAVFLNNWLWSHPHPFQNPELLPLLRTYKVRYILLHMQGKNEQGIFEEAQFAEELEVVKCFDPPSGPSPWPYPICIMKILPSSLQHLNVFLRDGWSGLEHWGVWAEGIESRVQWVATAQRDYYLQVSAFPHCAPGKEQIILFEVKGIPLMRYQWPDCEPWSAEIVVPASLVQVGWNDLRLRYAYAIEPAEVTEGANLDMRKLAVGFTRLEIVERR